MQFIGLVLSHGFDALSLAPLSVFTAANTVLDERRYEVRVLSETGGAVSGACGVSVITERFAADAIDTVLVSAGQVPSSASAARCGFLQDAAAAGARVIGVDLGAFDLAEAGLLAGRRATTRAAYAAELQQRHPEVHVETDASVVEDAPVWTCSSLVAGIEAALRLASYDLGLELAEAVADHLRAFPEGTAWAPPAFSQSRPPRSERIKRTLAFARSNLHKSLPIEELADVACLSPRQFTRVFRLEVGHSPARAIEQLRIEAARRLLVQHRLPVELVAEETGFGGRERMRRAFLRNLGKTPRVLRDEAVA